MILVFFFLFHFLETLSGREGFFAKKGGVSLVRNRDLRPAAKANPTIQQAFERFQKYNRLKNLSQGSLDFYAAKGRSFFRFLGNTEQPIHTITEETVEDYIFYMKDQQLHDTTINTNLRMVRAFLYWCMEKGYLEKYPIRLVRADDPIKEPYTTDELQKLLKEPDCKTCSFAEYRNWVIVNFLLGTGCRASTLLNLQIGDLDLSAGTVFFRHMKARNQQIVPLSKALVKIMEEYLEHRTSDPAAPLFVSEYGNQMTLNSLGNAIWNYNHSRGVDKTSMHLFRHTYAKLYIQAGGDPFRLQKLLGHASIKTTMDRYVHVTDDSMADQIIQQYEKMSTSSDKPIFLHAVTMQNHTNYNKDNYPDDQRVKVTEAPAGLKASTVGALEDFATGIRDADAMLGKLTEYFSQVDEPVILVFWGDHYNPIDSNYDIYTRSGYASDSSADPRLHQTTLLMWSNYSDRAVDLGTIAAYDISPVMMELFGLRQPLYFQFLGRQLRSAYRANTRGTIMEKDGTTSNELTPLQQKWSDEHWLLQYDLMFGKGYALGRMGLEGLAEDAE